jgi:hypothetical protein
MGTAGPIPGDKAAEEWSWPLWSYTSTPQYVFMAWFLVKHRDNFTFTLPYHVKMTLE